MPIELVLGLAFALLLNEEMRGRNILRSVMIVPYAMLTISNGLVWDYILDPTYGTLNIILQRWGLISNYQDWLGTPNGAMGWVIAADVWKTTPFMTIILLAALQTFPDQHVSGRRGGWGRRVQAVLLRSRCPCSDPPFWWLWCCVPWAPSESTTSSTC